MFQMIARIWEVLTRRIDSMLLAAALAIVGVGLVTLFSAADQSMARETSQVMSLSFAIVLMWMFANIAPQTLARAAVPLYVVAVAMLIGVALFGVVDRKSTRLNSSHMSISYAVFCLKKKKKLIYKALSLGGIGGTLLV